MQHGQVLWDCCNFTDYIQFQIQGYNAQPCIYNLPTILYNYMGNDKYCIKMVLHPFLYLYLCLLRLWAVIIGTYTLKIIKFPSHFMIHHMMHQ